MQGSEALMILDGDLNCSFDSHFMDVTTGTTSPRLSQHEHIKSAIKILQDRCISILDFMSTILDLSQLDFTVNCDQIYYSSKEEKENLKDKSSQEKLEQVLDYMFANSQGCSQLLNWFHPHAVTYVCETVSTKMDAMKEDLQGMLDSITLKFLLTWDLNSMM
ncbi:hypothetical protein DFH29DRAFT_1006128 [Suillus ampliporus]|nr:hypothetical protein DFH29DRAFT_1006128 [Suillus ampliporus]